MKRFLPILLVLSLLVSLSAGCTPKLPGFTKEGDVMTMTRGGVTVAVNSVTGMLQRVATDYDSLSMDGVFIDAGLNEASVFNQMGYMDMSALSTWELPLLWPRLKALPPYTVDFIRATEAGFEVSITQDIFTFLYRYAILENGLSLEVVISTSSQAQVPVNGVSFMVRGIDGFALDAATFEFPGSTPAGRHQFTASPKYRATSADYAAPTVQLTDGNKTANILYVNNTEKWTTGCYYDENGKLCAAYLAATEGYIAKDAPMEVGTLYLPMRRPDRDAYAAVSDFWTQLGYHTPSDTTATDELYAVYSGHPYGTMDTNYFNQLTLGEYAGQLSDIADMGFDAIWLLPVFQHTGDNVYEPIDEGVIDKRYGGLEEANTFIETAHSVGMKVLFDFVPHGPRPVYPFAKEHSDWISKDKQGGTQIEWDCVSMDYNHPEYAQYMKDLAAYYAREIGLDGARIDCSMGGLPNWSSATGLRASAAGLGAGINVVRAIREGFLEADTQVLLLPENFHPSPAYAPYTDVYYDMPMYRCIHDLNNSGVSETEFVAQFTHFLEAQGKTSVAGQRKLRFLGNHDTVTWTFDAERAQTLYGTEKAKALWMAIGWIDGVLYIYQGDEDPAAYHLAGEDLTQFFTELISAKQAYLPTGYRTAYLQTNSPVMAFYRYGGEEEEARLVLVNLSDAPQAYTLKDGDVPLTAIGSYEISGNTITLDGFTGIILSSSCSESGSGQ